MLSESFPIDHPIADDVQLPVPVITESCSIDGEIPIDLQNYISSYEGYIRYQRLFFIAQRCPSLRTTALSLAHDYIKNFTFDTASYNKVFLMLAEEQLGSSIPSTASGESPGEASHSVGNRPSNSHTGHLPDAVFSVGAGEVVSSTSSLSDPMKQTLASVMNGKNDAGLVYDAQWEESTRRKGTILLDQLDTELKNYKANSIKESIRRGSDDLGDLYLKLGQLNSARKCYTRSRDYCTSQQQEIIMCLNVIKVAIFQRAWAQVSAHVTRAYGFSDMQESVGASTTPSHTSQQRPRSGPSSRSTVAGASQGGSGIGTSRNGAPGSSSELGHLTSRRPPPNGSAVGIGTGQTYRDALAFARTQLAIAAGLVELTARNFRGAALSFLQASPDHCESPTSTIVTQSDLAYFVTLCTLATFDRSELANQVLARPSMRLLLEAEPACNDMLQSFHQADYSVCLRHLTKLVGVLQLDIFLSDHVTTLCREIRNRALCQYFSPYSTADLNCMARAFDTTLPRLEDELAILIQEGSIKARIDSHKQLLRVLNVNQRCLTFARALRLADEYKKRTQSMVLRMSLARQKLICQATREDSSAVLNYLT